MHSQSKKSPIDLLDPAARPWVLGLGGATVLAFCLGWTWAWGVLLLPLIFVVFFFRDPPRRVPQVPGTVVSPADGMVTHVQVNQNPEAGPVDGLHISIFLSVFNVHVNRVPYDGVVERLHYKRGGFVDARREDCAEVNEANTVYLETGAGPMTVRQVSGLIARRIICRVRPGEAVRRGQRFGVICFGSRTELILPAGSEALVRVGQSVKGGETALARVAVEGE